MKVLLEDLIQLMMLISAVYKDSIIGLCFLVGVLVYMLHRRVRTLVRVAYIVGICMMIQYGLALSNLTSNNNPMEFPDPFNPYPSIDKPLGQFIIPWYKKIPFLNNNVDWCMYLSIGISNVKLNGLWIDYFTIALLEIYFFYFGCQLFSLDYKISKGKKLQEEFEKYCEEVNEITNDDLVSKETKKLKNSIFIYNFYKTAKYAIFMNFHLITIVVTLLLAILTRSLFSFGYIIVCLYMVYENHKFFKRDQSNFRLNGILKFFLRPYVFFDLSL